MKHPARLVATFLALLVLTACGVTPTAQPPVDGADHALALNVKDGAAFLPPVGPDRDTSLFFAGAQVWIEVRGLDAAGLETGLLTPAFSTDDGTVQVQDEFYLALWRVSETVANAPDVSRVRVVALADGLAGTPLGDACGAPGPCEVGSFEAQIRKSKGEKVGGDVVDLTRSQTLPIKLFIASEGLRPTTLSELTPLTPGVSFDETGPNCMVNEFTALESGFNALGAGFNALGAGFNALGAVGGLVLIDPAAPADVRLFDPAEAGALARTLADQEGLGSLDTAILVVDDFGTAFALDDRLISLATLAPLSGDAAVDELAGLVQGPGFSHGALVMHQVLEMAAAAGYTLTQTLWDDSFHVFVRTDQLESEGDLTYLIVAAVDAPELDTDGIPSRIQNALNALRYLSDLDLQDDVDIARVAVNMSFVIVPCAIIEDMEGAALESFEGYVAALGQENSVASDFYDELTRLVVRPLRAANDPLLGQVEECNNQEGIILGAAGATFGTSSLTPPPEGITWPGLVEGIFDISLPFWSCELAGSSIVYVASSGNFGVDFPLYPAAWPLVVGVSSQDAITGGFGGRSLFSNSGEVMAPGSLVELGTTSGLALGYAGTSFAAPVVSLFSALDLTFDVPACALQTQSKLSWAADIGNMVLPSAVSQYCYGFGLN